jgi:hypothetical protein
LRNIDAYAEAYLDSGKASGKAAQVSGSGAASNSLGVVLTNWIPSRYVQRSIWDGFAYAAVALGQGAAVAQTSGLRRFVERHYGAEWTAEWEEVMALMYDEAPQIEDRETREWMGMPLVVPWSTDAELKAAAKDRKGSNPYVRLRSLLAVVEPRVRKNLGDFKAFALCAQSMECAVWRVDAVVDMAARGQGDTEKDSGRIREISARDAALVKALTADWDQGRPPDAEAKTELLYGLHPKDELLYTWRSAAAYSAELARRPKRFYEVVT